jgi:hypothetical protein
MRNINPDNILSDSIVTVYITNLCQSRFSLFWFIAFWISTNLSEEVSEWVSDCCLTLYHGENKLIFNEMMTRSTLYQTNTLSWIFLIVFAHWNKSPRIDIMMSPHSNTLSWFRANQSLLFLLNAACLAEKHQIPIS